MSINTITGPEADTGLLRPPAKDSNVQRTHTRQILTRPIVPASGYHYKQEKILQSTVDEVEIELSMDMYDRMKNDPIVRKDFEIIITNVLSDDLHMAPGQSEEHVSEEEFKIYTYVQELCERTWAGLESNESGRTMLAQILENGLTYGHGLGEIEWEYRMDGPIKKKSKDEKNTSKGSFATRARAWLFGGAVPEAAEKPEDVTPNVRPSLSEGEEPRLMPKSIKVKPRGAARFVVDDYMNIIGYVPASRTYRTESNRLALSWDEIIDPRKFALFTPHKQNEDPRGRSILRPIYNWYNLKVQLPSEMLRFVLEEIVPKGVATLPENDMKPVPALDENNQVRYDDDGNMIMETQAASFIRVIEGFRGGAHAVIPFGSTLKPYRSGLTGSNDANLFKTMVKIIDDQMENGILKQTMAQSEGENMGRSASQQVAEILYVLQFWYRWLVVQFVKSQIFAPVVSINLGDWALAYLPKMSIGDFARRDWVDELLAYADAYFKGLIDDSQRAEIMANLNLPKPGKSRQELQLEQGAKADVNGNPIQNNPSRPDKQEGSKGRNAGNGTEKKKR